MRKFLKPLKPDMSAPFPDENFAGTIRELAAADGGDRRRAGRRLNLHGLVPLGHRGVADVLPGRRKLVLLERQRLPVGSSDEHLKPLLLLRTGGPAYADHPRAAQLALEGGETTMGSDLLDEGSERDGGSGAAVALVPLRDRDPLAGVLPHLRRRAPLTQ